MLLFLRTDGAFDLNHMSESYGMYYIGASIFLGKTLH